ncbi:hypothetical protein FBY03_14110 [Pseudomonas sp. SJZ079]|nr:hypothetical protein FBY03_14110 [Pseudomonas sp. SJZ079]
MNKVLAAMSLALMVTSFGASPQSLSHPNLS